MPKIETFYLEGNKQKRQLWIFNGTVIKLKRYVIILVGLL